MSARRTLGRCGPTSYTLTYSRSNTVWHTMTLVDGRFRRACALYAMKYIDSTSVVLIDDWKDKSRGYHSVLEFFEQVELLSDMVVLRIKKNVDWTRWELAFKKALKDEM
eukprot:GHVU01122069.1.p4 GENE.GHVU01122069.1~~GHVU01122069.1.p4  ORF type:complete len:109 (-),score=10.32 GHVU01122069.1:582-908(-)